MATTTTLCLGIEPLEEGQNPFSLRIKNNGDKQREFITGYDRDEVVITLGQLADVVHGSADPAGLVPCTLAIFDFEIQVRDGGKRFREVQISILFQADSTTKKGVDKTYPRVMGMAPRGTYYMLPTKMKTEEKVTAHVNASGNVPIFGSVGADLGYELTTSTEREDCIRVNGQPRIINSAGMTLNKPNGVEWNLFENTLARGGVPAHIRTAVLLERWPGDGKLGFTARVKVREKVDPVADAVRKVKDIVGLIPRDDPVDFDPTLGPTTDKIPVVKMGEVKLHNLCTWSSNIGENIFGEKVTPEGKESEKSEEKKDA
jgi:hypothetical protein